MRKRIIRVASIVAILLGNSCCAIQIQHNEFIGSTPRLFYYTAVDNGDRLVRINPRLGNNVTASVNDLSHHGVTSLDYDATAETIFALVDGKKLTKVEIPDDGNNINGANNTMMMMMQVVGKTGLRRLTGLAAVSGGTMYTYSRKYLYSLDRNSGMIAAAPPTKLFNTGISGIVDMTYSSARRVLYATDGVRLYVFDPVRHQVETLGEIGGLNSEARLSGIVVSCDGSSLRGLIDGGKNKKSKIYQISPTTLRANEITSFEMPYSKSTGFAVQCNNGRETTTITKTDAGDRENLDDSFSSTSRMS